MIESMQRVVKLGLLIIAGLAVSTAASAQRGFGHAGVFASTARAAFSRPNVAPPVNVRPIVTLVPVRPVARHILSMRGSSATAAQTIQFGSLFVSSNPNSDGIAGSQVTLSQILNPVPGLGFDYSNLAAINRDLAVRAVIDPITQQELALSERLLQETPTTPISFPFFGTESQPVVMLEQQPPQVIVVQQPELQAKQMATEASASSGQVAAAAQQQPLPNVGDFVLVLNDGTQIHAVAFTRQSDRIVYITADGMRRSFPIDNFDVAATRRFNNERGTPLQLTL